MTVNIKGHETALGYAVTGVEDGPQVLVLHGWGSSSAVMSGLINGLADQCRVFSLDMPGHGLSPISPVPWGLPEQADAVSQFLEKHSTSPVTIVGHSNGGRIALYMASDVKLSAFTIGLVLFSPSGIRRAASFGTRVKRTVAGVLKAPFMLLPGRAREYGLDWLRHTIVWSLLGSSDYRALDGIMRETFVLIVNTYVQERLQHIHVPVLIFWGENDRDIDKQQIQALESGIPDAGVMVVENAGHYAFLDRTDIAIQGTLKFINAL